MSRGVSVQGCLRPDGSVSRGVSVQEVSVQGVSLFRGISVQGVSVQGDPLCTVTSRQYASYWNAFLFYKGFATVNASSTSDPSWSQDSIKDYGC